MNWSTAGALLAIGSLAAVIGQVSARGTDGGVAGGSTDCATAPALVIGSNPFDTTGSAVNLAVPSGGACSTHTIYAVNWFSFVPAATSNYSFSTCTGTSWDTRIAVYSGCPSAGQPLACNDDGCSQQSSVTASLTQGVTYRVAVGGFGASNFGTGTLTVANAGTGGGGGGTGADVIVGAIPSIAAYGSVVSAGQTIMAYAVGTTSCNIGTAQLEWFASPNNRHPFIPQNMFRHKDGRLEQIGMSWGKHGFTALQGTLCGACQASSTGTYLGVGCSDPYSASLNGSQSGLGARSEVNAATGYFPGTINQGMPAAPATIGRRLQVNGNDLNPSLNAGASYFVEAQYIHPQDAAGGNDNNNASWRAFTVGALTSGAYALTTTGPTVQQKCAIEAWPTFNPAVQLVTADVPDDGRFILGFFVRDNGNGTWRYEYAIQNLNSDRSGGRFSVPVSAGTTITNIGFRDVNYHSGDPYSPTDWVATVANGAVTWQGGEFAVSPNGNALRYATMYNFWFDASRPPSNANVALGLFKPGAAGAPNSVSFAARAPVSTGPSADINGDGQVNATDLSLMLGAWGASGPADINGDGTVNGVDLVTLLAQWGPTP